MLWELEQRGKSQLKNPTFELIIETIIGISSRRKWLCCLNKTFLSLSKPKLLWLQLSKFESVCLWNTVNFYWISETLTDSKLEWISLVTATTVIVAVTVYCNVKIEIVATKILVFEVYINRHLVKATKSVSPCPTKGCEETSEKRNLYTVT